MTREQMIDQAVRSVTGARQRHVAIADRDRYGIEIKHMPYWRYLMRRIRAEFGRLAFAADCASWPPA